MTPGNQAGNYTKEKSGLDYLKKLYEDYGKLIGSEKRLIYVVINKKESNKNIEKDGGEDFAEKIGAKFFTNSHDNKEEVETLFFIFLRNFGSIKI